MLLSLSAICFAQEKVFTNADLKNGITPPPPVAHPGTAVVTPPPPGARANNPENLYIPIQPPSLPGQKPLVAIEHPTPRAPAVKMQPKPYYIAGSLEETITTAFAKATLLMFLAVGIPLLLWIVTLIDILRSEFTGSNKMIWLLAATFLPFIGSVLYFFIGADQKIRPADEEEPVVRLI